MSLRRRLVALSLRRMNHDRLTVVYLVLSAFYPALKPSVFPHPWANAALHATLALVVWFVPPLMRMSGRTVWRLLGEIYLPLIFPMFYAELEYLGLIYFPFEGSLDPALISLEQWLFGFQPSVAWSQAWPWPWFHELMEFAYFTYYFLAAAFVWLVMREAESRSGGPLGCAARFRARPERHHAHLLHAVHAVPGLGTQVFPAGVHRGRRRTVHGDHAPHPRPTAPSWARRSRRAT